MSFAVTEGECEKSNKQKGKPNLFFLKVLRKYGRRQRVVSFEVHKVKVTIQ